MQRAYLEALSLPIYICTDDRSIVYMNRAMEELCGNLLLATCYRTIFGRSSICPWCPLGKESAGSALGYEWESKPIRKWFRITVTPLNDSEIGLIYVSLFVDITGEKRFAYRLKRAERVEAMGQMAVGVAHDFKNILGAILGFSDLIKIANGQGADEKDTLLGKRIAAVRTASERANGLVDRILSFARVDNDSKTDIDIHELIGETINLLDHAVNRTVRFYKVFEAESVSIYGDPQQIHTVFLNLVVCVKSYVSSISTITFKTLNINEIVPGSSVLKKMCEIKVVFGGCHIGEDVLESWFGNAALEGESGIQPGISIAQQIIANADGRIIAEATPGDQTVLRIQLPLSEHSKALISETIGPPQNVIEISGPKSGRHILVVDDEPLILRTVEELLTVHNFAVTVCSNGREALSFFRHSFDEIDVVLMDLVMPEWSGYDTFFAMKRIDPLVRVVLMTGDPKHTDVSHMMKSGIWGVVRKPFNMKALVDSLEQVIRLSSNEKEVI